MALLESGARLAGQGQPREAATLILDAPMPNAATAAALAEILATAARWDPVMLGSFQTHGKDYLIDGMFGRFWLVSRRPRRRLMPPAPAVTPRELQQLGQAVLACE